MEKDNLNDNEINNKVEETKTSETQENIKPNVNEEVESLITSQDEENPKQSSFRIILANALDQLLIVAGSSVMLLLCDLILKIFGYRFVRDNGVLILAGGIIYFIINCIYVPLVEKSKLKNTIARRILSIN